MLKDLILGAHAYFIPEGTTVDAQVVGPLIKPDTNPETNWTAFMLGSIENFQPQTGGTRTPRYAPDRGVYRLRTNLLTQRTLTFNLGIQEWDQNMLALLLGSAPPDNTGLIVPNSLGADPRGWLKIQAYDQNEDLIQAIDVWCEIRIDSYQFQNGVNPYTVIASVLSSPLNSGSISNMTDED